MTERDLFIVSLLLEDGADLVQDGMGTYWIGSRSEGDRRGDEEVAVDGLGCPPWPGTSRSE